MIGTTVTTALLLCRPAVMALLWVAPVIGALENKSVAPLLLLTAPAFCWFVLHQSAKNDLSNQHRRTRLIDFGGALFVTVIIHRGLQPVGGLLGPGGWFFWLFITGLSISLLKAQTRTTTQGLGTDQGRQKG
jgi:hypothetical protein